MLNCRRCAAEIGKDRRKNSIYCSIRCRNLDYKKKTGQAGIGLSAGTTGAVSELVVALDLMKKGYEVFRAMSPTCSCDLAILRKGQLLRIEVRTAHINGMTGNVSKNWPENAEQYDAIAWVLLNENRIIYEPELIFSRH